MLEAIKELGDYVREREGLNEVEIFVESPKFSESKNRLICLKFKELEGGHEYISCHAEDITEDKLLKCLYTESGGQKTNTFSLNMSKKNIESTVRKIERWLKIHKEKSIVIESVYKAFVKGKTKIIKDLRGVITSESFIVTIKVINGGEKFLGELDEVKDVFKRDNIRRLYMRKFGRAVESKGVGTCFLCGGKGKVYGFASPFEFYTVDKKGFAPYFNQQEAWKQLPICFNCASSLKIGRKKFLDRHSSLSFRFDKFQCYIIPKFVFKSRISDFIGELESIERTTTGSAEDLSYEMEQENGIIDTFSKQGDVLKLCFLYYTVEQARMIIHGYIEEIPPSWIKRLREAMEEVQAFSMFKEEALKQIIRKKHVGDIKFKRFGIIGTGRTKPFVSIIRDFFPSSKTEGMYDRYFMDVVSSILSRKPIDKDFMISAFVDRIRSAYKRRKAYIKLLCLKAFMLYLFLLKTNLLRGEESMEKSMVEIEGEDLESKVERFFSEHGFRDPAKRAAFSTGMLVDYLLWVQRDERGIKEFGKEPFWSNLYGLVLDEKKIKGLFPKVIGKLRQYGRGKPTLERVAGRYLAEAEQNWDISNDETSYYFALGMSLSGIFSKDKKEEGMKDGTEKQV